MDRKMKNKKGFGITEVLISAMVLGLLYMAILHMQTGNREALLRIRGRDGAIEVAQQVIDIAKSFNIDAQVVGHIEEGPRSLTINSEFGTFTY